ncbi:hypothetical protein GCM10027180_26410 [Microbulbifer echini]
MTQLDIVFYDKDTHKSVTNELTGWTVFGFFLTSPSYKKYVLDKGWRLIWQSCIAFLVDNRYGLLFKSAGNF